MVLLGALVPSKRQVVAPFAIAGLHLHTTGDPQQDIITIEYNGFLVDRAWAGWVEQAAVGFLMTGPMVDGRRRDELHLNNVTLPYDRGLAETGIRSTRLERSPSWRIDLDAVRATGQPYLDHLSPNTRQQVRRSMRLYERRGKLTAARARTPEALASWRG